MDWYCFYMKRRRKSPKMGAAEDVAEHGLRVSLGSMLESFGFGTATEDSLDLLTDVMKRFIDSISHKSKLYAEHAGRTQPYAKDVSLAFKKINFSQTELWDFMINNNIPPPKPLPKFPVPRANPRPLYHPQPSEKELETRPDHIPRFYQAAHPEWTREGADYLAVMKPSTSGDKKGSAPDFPDFSCCSAKSMGITREDLKPAPPIITRTDDSSATGIRSSANIASQKLYNPDYAAQLVKKKGRPLNGLKDSRSNTPLGRSNSSYDKDWESRTDSPSTSRSAEKQRFKPRPPSSASSRMLFETKPGSSTAALADEGSRSPAMPRLEVESFGQDSFHEQPASSDYDQSESFDRLETPPRIDENVINANILLFQQLKQQQEREEHDKREKEKEKEEKQRKKEEKKQETARKKEEQKREQEAIKQAAKEEEKRRKKEEKRLAQEKAREEKEARERELRKKLEESSRNLVPTIEEQKPIKLVITNPLSSNASSTFSPSPIRAPPSLREQSPPPFLSAVDNDDEDTIPYYGGTDSGLTTFPCGISYDSPKRKKKKKDKDRDRDSSPSSHKKHKKDKEHKRKKKREKEERERERIEKSSIDIYEREQKPVEMEQRPLKLKIRLPDQSPSNSDTSASTFTHEPVKLKFKLGTPLGTPEKREEEKVPPLRIGMPQARPQLSAEKLKGKNAETRTSPKFVDKEKEEKQRRKEERKKKDREETEQRQRAEYERIQKEHEEKLKREAAEKKRLEEEAQRERDEAERRREKERKRMEKELAFINATTEPIIKMKKEKEKEKKPKDEPKKMEDIVASEPLDEEDEKIWICPTCHVAWTEGANMVACDSCNDWFHWHCVGLLVAPDENTPWYCKRCSRKPMKRPIKTSNETPRKKKKSEGFGYLK